MATDGISGWNELRTLRAEVSALKVQLAALKAELAAAKTLSKVMMAALATTSAGTGGGDVSLVEFHSLVTHLRDVCDAESEGQRLVQAYNAGRAEERAVYTPVLEASEAALEADGLGISEGAIGVLENIRALLAKVRP